ncbi:MAG: hypothetical protein ACK5HT_12570 [Draconibacterium sp.]
MKKTINKAISATNGYKTKAAAFVWLIVSLLGNKVPLISENRELVVNIVDVLISTGLLHDLWRNKKKITEWVISLFAKIR